MRASPALLRLCRLALASLCLLACQPGRTEGYSTIDSTLLYDNNVTNAKLGSDIRSDSALGMKGACGTRIDLDELGTLDIAGLLSWQAHGQFVGLDEVGLGGRATLSRKLGLGLVAPVVDVSAEIAHESFQSGVRDGWQGTVLFGVRQRLSPAFSLRLDAGLQYRTQDHVQPAFADFSGAVFRQFDQVQDVSAELALSDHLSLSAGYQRRKGDDDLSIHGGPDADFGDALAISADPSFGPNTFALRVKAVTQSALAGLNYALGRQSSASIEVRYDVTREPSGDIYRRLLTSLVYSYAF